MCFYKGIKYRSTLESRWALFFDYLRIPYKYEPLSLKTSSYNDNITVPDFIIDLRGLEFFKNKYYKDKFNTETKLIIVEIKPSWKHVDNLVKVHKKYTNKKILEEFSILFLSKEPKITYINNRKLLILGKFFLCSGVPSKSTNLYILNTNNPEILLHEFKRFNSNKIILQHELDVMTEFYMDKKLHYTNNNDLRYEIYQNNQTTKKEKRK
jgi:hypothetical protein